MTNLLESIAIDIQETVPKTESGKSSIVLMMDCFLKLAKAIPTTKITATTVGTIFEEHGLGSSGISTNILSDGRPQFIAKLLAAVCTQRSTKAIATTEYYFHANNQIEPFTPAIVSTSRNNVVEHRKDGPVRGPSFICVRRASLLWNKILSSRRIRTGKPPGPLRHAH